MGADLPTAGVLPIAGAADPATLADLRTELQAIRQLLQAQAGGAPELLDARAAAALLGISRASLFRLVAARKLPRPIRLTDQLKRWRRAELLEALAK